VESEIAGPTPLVRSCPTFLNLLGQFYAALPEPLSLEAVLVAPAVIPEPYRRLLVHANDMTSTLERFYGEQVELSVLHRWVDDDILSRHIVLIGAQSRRPVEYGAIRIHLPAMDETARQKVLECRLPLGGILKSQGVAHKGCPGGFFTVQANDLIRRALQLQGQPWLYGRCNCLSNAAGRTIAEVVEILPNVQGQI
jgi:chorismate-pyruvate lyase